MAQKTGGTTNFASAPQNDYPQYQYNPSSQGFNPNSINGSNNPYGLPQGSQAGGVAGSSTGTSDPYGLSGAGQLGSGTGSVPVGNSMQAGQTATMPTNGLGTQNANTPQQFSGYEQFSGQAPTQSSFTNGAPQGYNSFGGAQMSYGNTGMNPYLDQMEKALTEGSNKNLNENILPGINRSANAVGGYGGARQGLAQGNAIGTAQTGLNSAIANMRSGAYESAANRSLQSAALNNQSGQSWMNYDLGRRGLDLQGRGQDYGFYSTNRGQDLQELLAGMGLTQAGNQGLLGQGQGIYGLGATENQANQQPLNFLSGILNGYAGLGTTTTGTQQYQYNPTQQWIGTIANAIGAIKGSGGMPGTGS